MAQPKQIRFGVASPQIHFESPLNLDEIQTYIRRAEALGYHSLWVQEQSGLKSSAFALESVSMLSYAAALTQTIRLGVAVFIINLRNPLQLAKSLASLDQLSRGRLLVGVGLGGVTRLYQAYGLSAEARVARFNEALALMKRLWSEEDLTFEGKFWQVKGASLRPRPFQSPHPPIWFGGHAPAALKRAVQHGSGFIGAGSSSTADFQSQVGLIRAALAEAKKHPDEFTIGKRVYLAVDVDRERAAKRLREWFGSYYGKPELADRVAIWGNRDDCVAQLRDLVAAGAQLLVLNPVFDLAAHLETLASDVIPRVSAG